MDLTPYLEVTRAKFLSLSIVVVFAGACVSYYQGNFSSINSLVALLTVIMLHISVNSLNTASDYRTGIDEDTEKTAFSGGVDTVVNDRLSYEATRNIGIATIFLSIPSFVYFTLIHNFVIVSVIAIVGLVSVVGYTDLFARIGLGEISAGIGLGALPVLATTYVQTGMLTDLDIYVSGLLFVPVFNLIILNEYPDIPVDKENGRVNIPILFGREVGMIIYLIGIILLPVGYISLVLLNYAPVTLVIAILPIVVLKPVFETIIKRDFTVTEEILKSNTLWVHLIYVTTGISLIIGKLI